MTVEEEDDFIARRAKRRRRGFFTTDCEAVGYTQSTYRRIKPQSVRKLAMWQCELLELIVA